MDIAREIVDLVKSNSPANSIENLIKEGSYKKLKFSEYNDLLNHLFPIAKSQIVKIVNSYYNLLVGSPTSQFIHLRVEQNPKQSCMEMIQSYKYIFMFNRYLDCSELLLDWSPTESYYPLIVYIQKSNPDIPIDYTYWIDKFTKLPDALSFLKKNKIRIEFSSPERLSELYKTIPEQYVKDFIGLIGDSKWYMDVIKKTDHFLDEVED